MDKQRQQHYPFFLKIGEAPTSFQTTPVIRLRTGGTHTKYRKEQMYDWGDQKLMDRDDDDNHNNAESQAVGCCDR